MNKRQRYASDIKLGEKYRDDQTGIEGTAAAIHFFQHGCERVTVELLVKGELKEYTFDAPRLRHIATGRLATTDRTGGPERFTDAGRSTGGRR
ncbi:hypothetical protein [Gordonia sp. OPL2]|uniref:hypothetical protein n=1 Tax=Gordonia sp. OPL2 TaxID=2486274 RepID=UPI0016555C4B|nr:hypothetical protein [Gordonia sp. OPL2]ROZ88972.1 hypothetical protein EEB19_19880 [Gordonia sp. OPL2]